MKAKNEKIISKLKILCIIFAVLGIFFFCRGMYKIHVYNNPDSSSMYIHEKSYKNAYVEGDAYNYIINGTHFTGYMVVAMGCGIIAAIAGVGAAVIAASENKYNEANMTNSNKDYTINSDTYDDELPEI